MTPDAPVILSDDELRVFDFYFAGICHMRLHPRNSNVIPVDPEWYERAADAALAMLTVRRRRLTAAVGYLRSQEEHSEPDEPLPEPPRFDPE